MGEWRGTPHEDIPRCGAKTRSGGFCGHFSMKNGRCRYHGGKSTGAMKPKTKHGYYTKEAVAERKWLNGFLKESKEMISEMD